MYHHPILLIIFVIALIIFGIMDYRDSKRAGTIRNQENGGCLMIIICTGALIFVFYTLSFVIAIFCSKDMTMACKIFCSIWFVGQISTIVGSTCWVFFLGSKVIKWINKDDDK